MAYYYSTPKYLYRSSAFEHLGYFQVVFFSVETYTATVCCHSNHTDLPQPISTYFLGYSLRNNIITAVGMIRILDCDDFCFV